MPDMSTYRPFEERHGGPPPPLEQRFAPPVRGQPVPQDRRPAPRKRRWLRAVAWTVGGLGALAACGVAALVVFAPVGILRDQMVREVQVRTGRDLVIAGRTSLSFWPSLGVTMGNVSLSAPAGMGGAPFVRMRQLEVRAALLPLLSRRVEVERLVLSEPVFELRVDQRGRQSWDFASIAGPATIMVAQAPPRQQQQPGQGGTNPAMPAELQDFLRNATQPDAAPSPAGRTRRASVPDIALGDVRIENGTVRYRDDRTGLSEEVRAVNAQLSAKSLASPVEAKGDLALRGDRIEFQGRIGAPTALLEDRPSRVALAINSPKARGRYDGSLSIARGAQLDGNVKLDAASVRELAAWIGARLPPGPGLGTFALEGELKTGPTWVALNNAKAKLDEFGITGSASLDQAGGRPTLKANLQLGTLDLNPYLGHAGGAAPTAPPAGQAPPSALPSGGAPPAAAKAEPQIRGSTERTGWSDAPIDLAGLGLLDAELRLALAGLVYKEIKLGATQASLTLKNRSLRTTIDDMRLYGGQGRGVLTLEPNGQAAAVGVNLALDGVSGLPLLKDASGLDWIDGKGRIAVAVAGTGAHQRGIMETLAGKAEFGFTDGAIIGFNFPQLIRGLSQGRLSGLNRVPTERTDFSEAGASFQIRNGVAETKDLRALSPLLRLTGAGTANLGQRQIDMTLRPRVVGTLSGQGGAAPGDLSGLEVPIKVRGAWERPQIAPDLDGLLKNPQQAIDTIREIGRQIQQGKGGNLNSIIEQFKRR